MKTCLTTAQSAVQRSMRILVLLCPLLISPITLAQVVPLDRFEVLQSRDDRLEIEVVPIIVVDPSIFDESEASAIDRVSRTLAPQVAQVFSNVHEAMQLLGLNYHQYTLYYGDHVHVMVCEEATVDSEQSCIHGDLGLIADLRYFVRDLYDNRAPPRGTVQLNVVILEDGIAWRGVLGVASGWYWGDLSLRHWTTRSCRAWALQSVWVIAHELGHCFGLEHNENDTDRGLDLMVSHYAHFNWVKESNKAIVQNHFKYPPPELPRVRVQPRMDFQF